MEEESVPVVSVVVPVLVSVVVSELVSVEVSVEVSVLVSVVVSVEVSVVVSVEVVSVAGISTSSWSVLKPESASAAILFASAMPSSIDFCTSAKLAFSG